MLDHLIDRIKDSPFSMSMLALGGLIFAVWATHFLVKELLLRGFDRLLRSTSFGKDESLRGHGIIGRLANIVPILVLLTGLRLVPELPAPIVQVVTNVSVAFIILSVSLALSAFLNLVNTLYYRRPDAGSKPIKGYIQIAKIVIFLMATILIIAALVDRSPLILLSGLGAITAVLILIFQDTLLSFVASVQISSSDMVRIGDWVEMPQLNADGDVIDIALHTVKVQNFDKTITTIPTRKLITDSFKNWRGMQEAGGRRIKRSLFIDQSSIHFLNQEEYDRLKRFRLLEEYLRDKGKELADWNEKLGEHGKESVNTRRITNIGTFRAYVERYLRTHPSVHQGLNLMVRQLAPTAEGLPLEIYCFTNSTVWPIYENIQSDIFDHLYAILPEFNLRAFQKAGGYDIQQGLAAKRGGEAPAYMEAPVAAKTPRPVRNTGRSRKKR
ncbi:mechanosensitive ion channel [bacterium]|nr:mechanosensitive ion channel [bacterium]